jgi:hypothetical protein
MNCEACAKIQLESPSSGAVAIAGLTRHMCDRHKQYLSVRNWPTCPDGWSFDELRGLAGCWIAPGNRRHIPGNTERRCPQTEKLTRDLDRATGMNLWDGEETL